MIVIDTVQGMQSWSRDHEDRPRAAVYTMGALHEGHLELVRSAQLNVHQRSGQTPYVIASIFVNPTQFTNSDDLANYPRTLEADLALLESVGVDAVFVPSVEQMYPSGTANTITVDPGSLGDVLEGKDRPGHFRGVLTVVNKLFNATTPNFAFFGEKDFQQLTLIQHMANEFNSGITVLGVPTVRDSDGLALSSRNRRLDDNARRDAAHIPSALMLVRDLVAKGVPVSDALNRAAQVLANTPAISMDYLVVTGSDLQSAPSQGNARVLIAANLNGVRLIDNMEIEIKEA